jgi:hypothetical protein
VPSHLETATTDVPSEISDDPKLWCSECGDTVRPVGFSTSSNRCPAAGVRSGYTGFERE